MGGVAIRGTALCCALGVDAGSCATKLLQGGAAPAKVSIPGLAEPVELSYFRIADGAELFDPTRFERLLPAVVAAALGQAALTAEERRGLPIYIGSSCYSIGLSESNYSAALASGADALPMPDAGYEQLATLARHGSGAEGPSFSYNTACTASANALLAAARALAAGRYPHALVVGAELANRTTLTGFSGLQLLAERVQPFTAGRQGIVLGEGIGAVLLSATPRPGETLLLGGASNCDTFSVTTANPDGASVAVVLKQALLSTATDTSGVRGIRSHGTATSTGDMAEALGLRKVFGAMPALSVLKPFLGHTLGGCGVNELVLYIEALQRGVLPSAPGLGTPDPDLGVQALAASAEAQSGRYLLNHFGFGGNNTVLVLERP